jgi:hypothetical protein
MHLAICCNRFINNDCGGKLNEIESDMAKMDRKDIFPSGTAKADVIAAIARVNFSSHSRMSVRRKFLTYVEKVVNYLAPIYGWV